MSTVDTSTEPVRHPPDDDRDAGRRRPRRRRRWVLLGGAVVVVAGAVLAVTDPFASPAGRSSGGLDNSVPTTTGTVTRQTLTSQTSVNGTLGYAGSYSVVNQAHGTLTALPAVGQVVSQGQVLYRVADAPVVLLYGSTPAYRDLAEGSSTPLAGPDVQQLDADLVALGDATSTEIPAGTDEFTYWTKVGVEKLQASLGVTQTGTLALGQVVFLPTAARITGLASTVVLGGSVQPGTPVLTASSTTRVVTVSLDAAQESEVKVGDKVTVTLPDRHTTPGVVSSVGTVATVPSGAGQGTGKSATPTITVVVKPTDPKATGTLDQAPVQVAITTASAPNVLVVPVDALLALSGGGYALEVVGANGTHSLVPVGLGIFDDAESMVQVRGAGLRAGQRIVVPGT